MFRIARWATPLVALALLVGLSVSRATAEDAKAEKGTVKGKVVDKDGAAVEGAKVRLLVATEHGGKGGGEKNADKKKTGDADKLAADAPATPEKPKGEKPKPVAEATTDKDGAFSMPDVPAGDYRVVSQVKGKGRGFEKVTVKAGETAEVQIKLTDVPPKTK